MGLAWAGDGSYTTSSKLECSLSRKSKVVEEGKVHLLMIVCMYACMHVKCFFFCWGLDMHAYIFVMCLFVLSMYV